MQKLILLYWGTVFLMYLSQVYYPTEAQLQGCPSSRHHFMGKKSDVFMMIVVFWLVSFSFLRVSYNDSLLSSKEQKNNRMMQRLVKGAVFSSLFAIDF